MLVRNDNVRLLISYQRHLELHRHFKMGLRHHWESTFWKGHLLALLGSELSKVIHDQIFPANLPHSVYDSDHRDKRHPTSWIPCWSVSCGALRSCGSRTTFWGNICFSNWEESNISAVSFSKTYGLSFLIDQIRVTWTYCIITEHWSCQKGCFLTPEVCLKVNSHSAFGSFTCWHKLRRTYYIPVKHLNSSQQVHLGRENKQQK